MMITHNLSEYYVDYGFIDDMTIKYTGIKFTHFGNGGRREQIMYSIYMDFLLFILKG